MRSQWGWRWAEPWSRSLLCCRRRIRPGVCGLMQYSGAASRKRHTAVCAVSLERFSTNACKRIVFILSFRNRPMKSVSCSTYCRCLILNRLASFVTNTFWLVMPADARKGLRITPMRIYRACRTKAFPRHRSSAAESYFAGLVCSSRRSDLAAVFCRGASSPVAEARRE